MDQDSTIEITECPACDSGDLDESVEAFDYVCNACGFVIRNSSDCTQPDWMVVSLDGSNQSETKEWLEVCKVHNSTEKQLAQAFDAIESVADQVGLGSSKEIRLETAELYCDAFRSGTTDGRPTTALVAACFRLCSQDTDCPIPLGRIADLSDVDETKLHLCQSALQTELDFQPPTPEPVEYLPFVKSQLSLSKQDLRAAKKLLKEVGDQSTFVGKDPAGVAAGVVYFTQDQCTQSAVADAVGVSTETVRKRCKQLREVVKHD